MISSRRFFFPESCVRQLAETSGKDTFTAWASTQVQTKLRPIIYIPKASNLCMYILGARTWIFTSFKMKEEFKLFCHPKWRTVQVQVGEMPHTR
jgi:hypothetical protein